LNLLFAGKATISKKEVGSSRISVEMKNSTGVKMKTEAGVKEVKVIVILISLFIFSSNSLKFLYAHI
jgi:hypothetical protein